LGQQPQRGRHLDLHRDRDLPGDPPPAGRRARDGRAGGASAEGRTRNLDFPACARARTGAFARRATSSQRDAAHLQGWETSPVNTPAKPAMRPARAEFSSGPCAKRPGWSPENLRSAVLGRSHRSKLGKARLKAAINQTREVLQVPADYLIGIVPASDT